MSFRLTFVSVVSCFVALWPTTAAPHREPSVAEINPQLLNERWPARWITHPQSTARTYEVLLFRRRLELSASPETFRIHLSADNRYRLWVNGTSLATGPQRDDLTRWRFDTIDLAPHLRAGENVIAVQVWNYGVHRPIALHSLETGLIVQGDGPNEAAVNTGADGGWRVTLHEGLKPEPIDRALLQTYIVVAPGDRLDAARTPWGWQEVDFDDSAWSEPRRLSQGTPVGFGVDIIRWLAPRNLPMMEETSQAGLRVRRASTATVTPGPLSAAVPLQVEPRSRLTLLLDQGTLTTAFPEVRFSGGRGATVRLEYAEALFDENRAKGHRDEIDGRKMMGLHDTILPDGGRDRLFSPLDYRTYRYVEVTIETQDEALSLEDLSSRFTAYPFEEDATFRSSDPALEKIWEIGWRTARLCAYETYIDCPYYEQLQYLGDTRIQALISLYVSGDDRLMRQAIDLFYRSIQPDGLTQSRYPSHQLQVINTFSLFWIGMLHDYRQLRDDPDFLRRRWRGAEGVLGWFEERLDTQTGLLGPLPYWSFVDWADEWKRSGAAAGGEPPGAREGGSAIISLLYALTLQEAARVIETWDEGDRANEYRKRAAAIVTAVRDHCWNEQRQLFSDTPEQRSYSEHVNALAVLAGAVEIPAAAELLQRLRAESEVVRCTVYFRFYLLRAFKAAGLGDEYLAQLGPWHDMMARGLTTFAERPDPTRSDCHAWSASPVYEFLATVAGIEPASPGFKTVRITPHPGHLQHFEASMPHPAGIVRMAFTREGEAMTAQVTLPEEVSGTFEWRGRQVPLRPGQQTLAW